MGILKDDAKLDITKLDQHALDQPALYDNWGEKWAEAVAERDKLKEKLSVVRAEADDEIRRTPKDFGWEQDKAPTETWVANQVVLHPKVRDSMDEFLTAQKNVSITSVAKEVLDHRKKSLEILTELYKNNYFSARARTNPDYLEKKSEKSEKVQEEQKEQLQKDSSERRRRRVV